MKRASEKSSQADCKSCRAKKAKCENFFSNEDEHDYVKFCKGGVAKEISANISDQECELFFFYYHHHLFKLTFPNRFKMAPWIFNMK